MVVMAAAGAIFSAGPWARANLLTGPGGSGVIAGQSSLIGTYDFTDTFTGTADGGQANRPYVPAVQTAPTYLVEHTFANPPQNFQTGGSPAGVASFSIASDTQGQIPANPVYPGSSGAGSATGFTQTGGGSLDYGLAYGLRTRYIVQVDAITSDDRIDITSAPSTGNIFQANSVTVFFRAAGGLDLYNGTTDTAVAGFNTGLTGPGQWHNYAVLFDQDNKKLQIYVDEQNKGSIDLTTFAGGLYQNYSNAAVTVGSGNAAYNRTWTDNFQVGAVPEPGSLAALSVAGALLFGRRRHCI